MPVRPWFALLISVILGVSGCMKAAEMVAAPAPQAVKTAATGVPDLSGEFSRVREERLRSGDDADRPQPPLYLAEAARFEATGEEGRVVEFLDKSRDAYAERNDASGEALVFLRRILFLSNAGRDREARDLLGEAAKTWVTPPLSAFPHYLEGRFALIAGDVDRATEFLGQALQDNTDYKTDAHLFWLRRDSELAAGMAAVLAAHLPRLGAAYRRPETSANEGSRAEEGRAFLQEALALNRELEQTAIGSFIPEDDYLRCEAEAYAFLGLDAGMRQEGEEAIRHLAYAAELSRRAGFREGEIRSHLFIGELGLGGETAGEGLRATELLLEMADRWHASSYRIWARLLIARYGMLQGQHTRAITALREAGAIVSAGGPGPDAEMFGRICRLQRREVFQLLVEILAAERRDDEALSAAEAAKAVSTADLLTGQDIAGNAAGRELLAEEKKRSETIRILQRRVLKARGDALAEKRLEQLTDAEQTYREILDRLGQADQTLLSLVSPRGIDAPFLQSLLDADTTLFDYFATERVLYVWAVHRERIRLERLDLPREELRRLVFSFLGAIRGKNRKLTDTLSRRLYDRLLKPIIPFVSGDRLGFITDDCLAYFPFAAMNYRGKFLVEGFRIFYLPAAELLGKVMAKKTQARLRILAFGNPDLEDETLDLHYAVQEIQTIRKRVGSATVLLNKQASESRFAEMMASYDLVHFAVRGQFDPDEPLRSGLLLTPEDGQDGILTAREIFRLGYSGQAVVLSGCDTIPEVDPEGSSFSLLQRAFLGGGTPSVVSSLWLVQDRTASHLLELFYGQLAKRASIADALRAAQLRLMRQGSPPLVWAAFILTGRY